MLTNICYYFVLSVIGGLRGVVYTEVVQTVVLIVGAVLVLAFGLNEVGGISEFRKRLPNSYFHMIRPASDPVIAQCRHIWR